MACARKIGFVLICSLLLVLAGGCEGGKQSRLEADSTALAEPEFLTSALAQEFERLGIDPNKVPMAAPTGSENRTFFVHLFLLDPDGPGGNPPQGVEVYFVEQCVGDYDQNGEVGISDLTPLGQYFGALVAYDPPAAHNGFATWPSGPPEDDGGAGPGNPAAAGSPAENWRWARIDGDANGELNISDVTPIAQHWQMRMDGYRVYRKRPGEAAYMMLPHLDPGITTLTITRPIADNTRPTLYSYMDDQLGAATGIFEYYVVPYDDTNALEGIESIHVSIDLATGAQMQAPLAQLSATPTSGAAPLTVSFDASSSSDPDGTIAKYEWDWDGDSAYDLDSGATPNAQNTYTIGGTYNAQVQVTDNDGATGVATVAITVTGSSNQNPVAVMTHYPITGPAPLQVIYSAGTSYDPDGTITNFGWDFDTDGTIDLNTATGSAANTFTAVNKWKTTLTVTDNLGATGSVFVFVDVTGPGGPNFPPSAILTATPSSGSHPLTVNFDATGSTDSDGTISGYSWDFDGDLMWDLHTTPGTTTYVYHQPGSYGASVRVYDDDAASDDAFQTINVSAGGPFWHLYTADSATFQPEECSLATISGNPAIAYSYRSDEKIRYVRATDTKGTAWGNRVDVASAGMYCAEVSLATVNGKPAIAYRVNDNMPPDEVRFDRADDATGTGWSSTVLIASGGAMGDHCCLAVVNGFPAISYSDAGLQYAHAINKDGTAWLSPIQASAYGGQYSDILMVSGNPAICHYMHAAKVYYNRAADIDGLDWTSAGSTFVTVDPSGGQFCSMELAFGMPAICYYYDYLGNISLRYARATTSEGTAWGTPQVVVSGVNDAGKYCSMTVVNGIPIILYRDRGGPNDTHRLMCVAAQDPAGNNWGTPEVVGKTWVGHISAASVNGYPAVAWCSTTGLEYAVKY